MRPVTTLASAADEVVLAVRPKLGRASAASTIGFTLVLAAAHAACSRSADMVALLRSTVDSECADALRNTVRERAESRFAQAADRYTALAASVRANLAEPETYLGFWAGALGTSGSAMPETWALCARLGLASDEIGVLSWLASLVIACPAPATGYHDSDLDTPARAYHEQAKLFADTMAARLPRLEIERPSRPDTVDVALPAPGALRHPLLADCLAARRSDRGAYGGEVTTGDLATLLATATGERAADRRPYPSPGAWFPSRVLVLPAKVAGLPVALHEYLPRAHGLRTVRSSVDLAPLLRGSAYFDHGLPMGVDAETVPLWLFIVADIDSIARRYGARAYRFLLMEVGHLAQNLVLTATGLGLRSVTLGSFYDDLISQFLGLDGVNEAPFYLIPIGGPR